MVSIVVAMTRDGAIGDKGTMPWHIREESEHFRSLTAGNAVIMGKNTWISIPERFRPLPDRLNIVVSSTMGDQKWAVVCRTIEEAAMIAEASGKGEAFCIGGAKLYEAMLPMAKVLHISWIEGSYKGDTYFPKVDWTQWQLKKIERYDKFTYEKYLRKD